MRPALLAAALAAFSLAATAVSAQTAPAQPGTDGVKPTQTASAAQVRPDDGDKVLCRDDETTGQRIKSRICHTKREWRAMEDGAKQRIHDLQERPGAGCPGCR